MNFDFKIYNLLFQAENSHQDDETDDSSSIYDEDLMATLIQELAQIGEVTLVRYVGETMWITFRDGQSALTALQKRSVCICGVTLHFKLKTENWLAQVEEEIELCTTNTVQLCDTPTHTDYNCLGIPKVPPQRPKSPANKPPNRPPLPKSPTPSPKHFPKAGVISVIPELLGKLNKIPPTLPLQQQHHQQTPSGSGSQMSTPAGTPAESMSPPHHESSAAIYEEINEDIVSRTHTFCDLTSNKITHFRMYRSHVNHHHHFHHQCVK